MSARARRLWWLPLLVATVATVALAAQNATTSNKSTPAPASQGAGGQGEAEPPDPKGEPPRQLVETAKLYGGPGMRAAKLWQHASGGPTLDIGGRGSDLALGARVTFDFGDPLIEGGQRWNRLRGLDLELTGRYYILTTAAIAPFLEVAGGLNAPSRASLWSIGGGLSMPSIRHYWPTTELFGGMLSLSTRHDSEQATMFGLRLLWGHAPYAPGTADEAQAAYRRVYDGLISSGFMGDIDEKAKVIWLDRLAPDETRVQTLPLDQSDCYLILALDELLPVDRATPDVHIRLSTRRDRAGQLSISDDLSTDPKHDALFQSYCTQEDDKTLSIEVKNTSLISTWAGVAVATLHLPKPQERPQDRFREFEEEKLRRMTRRLAPDFVSKEISCGRARVGTSLHFAHTVEKDKCQTIIGVAPPGVDLDALTFVERDGAKVWELVDLDTKFFNDTRTSVCNSQSGPLTAHTIFSLVPAPASVQEDRGKREEMPIRIGLAARSMARTDERSGPDDRSAEERRDAGANDRMRWLIPGALTDRPQRGPSELFAIPLLNNDRAMSLEFVISSPAASRKPAKLTLYEVPTSGWKSLATSTGSLTRSLEASKYYLLSVESTPDRRDRIEIELPAPVAKDAPSPSPGACPGANGPDGGASGAGGAKDNGGAGGSGGADGAGQ